MCNKNNLPYWGIHHLDEPHNATDKVECAVEKTISKIQCFLKVPDFFLACVCLSNAHLKIHHSKKPSFLHYCREAHHAWITSQTLAKARTCTAPLKEGWMTLSSTPSSFPEMVYKWHLDHTIVKAGPHLPLSFVEKHQRHFLSWLH